MGPKNKRNHTPAMLLEDDILAQIGLRGDSCSGKKDVAITALRNLIKSGKVSMDDVKVAVQAARDAKDAGDSEALPKKKNTQKGGKPRTIETYRTRHVALQFSYDGTEFTGFAENVGKEYDNSVEKSLFAALQKTRLLVSPDENGSLAVNGDDKTTAADPSDEAHVKKGLQKDPFSVRTASQYSRCGRTDKGVHAHGQVVALHLKSAFPLSARLVDAPDQKEDTVLGDLLKDELLPKNSLDSLECLVPRKNAKGNQRKSINEYDYPRTLNKILPPSIRILGWCPVSPTFSARFSCFQRTYRYFFPRRTLDLSAMAQGLQHMMGRHDFRNLCKMNPEQVYNFERVLVSGKVVSPEKVYSVASIEAEESCVPSTKDIDGAPQSTCHDMCHVEIVGQAFLWHQIRCIMSILFCIGQKLESPEVVLQLLDISTNPGKPSYEMASETALVLQDCKFRHLDFGRTVLNSWEVTKVLEQRWETHAVVAERTRNALESIKKDTEVRWSDVVDFVGKTAQIRRKKEQKRNAVANTTSDHANMKQELEKRSPGTSTLSWSLAIQIIENILGVFPHLPNGSNQGKKGHTESTVHVPLMERSRGTTYEEKVQSILGEGSDTESKPNKSTKRKDRYEDNIIRKRKTAEEDKAFYDHMLRQGGSSV